MATVVVDSTNLAGVLADAAPQEAPALPLDDNASTKVVEPQAAAAEPVQPDVDDSEEEHDFAKELGITPEQQKRFEKILRFEVGKKTRRAKEAEEFAAAQYSEKQLAEQQARDLAEENARLKEQLQPKKIEGEKPAREKYESDEAFQEAMDDWRVDQRFKAREAQQEEKRREQIVESAKARIAHALEIVPDFQAVTGSVDFMVPDLIAVWMQQSARFAELGYHFAKNPDELGRLAIMEKTKAEVAFKEIEAKLQPFAPAKVAKAEPDGTPPSPKTDPVPSRPRASAPITPLSQASSVQVVKDEATMDVREVITDWQRKNKVNLERRKRH